MDDIYDVMDILNMSAYKIYTKDTFWPTYWLYNSMKRWIFENNILILDIISTIYHDDNHVTPLKSHMDY